MISPLCALDSKRCSRIPNPLLKWYNVSMSIKISYSEADTYRQCALKHQLKYIERWRSDETAPALSRGTQLHAALEYHYQQLQLRDVTKDADVDVLAKTHAALVEKGLIHDEGGDEAVTWMLEGYLDFYGCDNAWEIVATEQDFEVPLYDYDGKESRFVLRGRIDLIVKNKGTSKIFVVDHKTCSNLPTEKALEFDEQMAFYTIAARRAGYPVYGAIYNAIRSKKLVRAMTSEERFLRKFVTKTDFELKTVEEELVATMETAYNERKHDAPRTPDSERCNWKCDMREACIAGRKMGPERMRAFLTDTGFKQPADHVSPVSAAVAEPVQMDLMVEIAKVEAKIEAEYDGDWFRFPGHPWQLKKAAPLSKISQLMVV